MSAMRHETSKAKIYKKRTMKTLQDIQKEFDKRFMGIIDKISLETHLNGYDLEMKLKQFLITSIKQLLEQVVVEEKEQLDKNDPDNYGACYAIGGWNDCRQEVEERIQKIIN